MAALKELVEYTDRLLAVSDFHDYTPNGLQVEGTGRVARIVSGVTANRALLAAAVKAKADLVLVHHGFFWRGEDPRIVGIKQQRIKLLLQHDISLLAYHLPLDGHPELGNNAQLGARLGWRIEGRLGAAQLGLYGTLPRSARPAELVERLTRTLGRKPLHIEGGPERIGTIGWCTGAAQDFIEAAADLGLDAFVSGEISERTVHVAREAGIHYFACGHHATERYGVQALGEHLAGYFDISHEFIEIENPV